MLVPHDITVSLEISILGRITAKKRTHLEMLLIYILTWETNIHVIESLSSGKSLPPQKNKKNHTGTDTDKAEHEGVQGICRSLTRLGWEDEPHV